MSIYNKDNKMIKIKLQESRTLPVSRELVAAIEPIYKKAFLKLAEVFILDELKTSSGTSRKFYSALLQNLYDSFPEIKGANIPIDERFLYSLLKKMNSPNKEERSLQITEIPVATLINIFESDSSNPLEAFLRGRMSKKQAIAKIKKYFKEKNINSLGINIELQKTAEIRNRSEINQTDEETYSGLYLSDIGAISIVFEAAFFTGIALTTEDGRRLRLSPRMSVDAGKKPETIIGYLKDELYELPISIRHELQHFYQSLFSKVFGVKDFSVGGVPRQVSRRSIGSKPDLQNLPHHMQPVEMQTDIQDEIDKFHKDFNNFKESNPDKEEMYGPAAKIMLKIFVGSELSMQEKQFARMNKLHNYMLNGSEFFRDLKSDDKSGELYKYALRTIYSSIGELLKEQIVMNKIKVILIENQKIISEELNKEEIRKLVRDELEKMLRDKETKKEIAKISKELLKKLYRELSFSSTHIIDQIDI